MTGSPLRWRCLENECISKWTRKIDWRIQSDDEVHASATSMAHSSKDACPQYEAYLLIDTLDHTKCGRCHQRRWTRCNWTTRRDCQMSVPKPCIANGSSLMLRRWRCMNRHKGVQNSRSLEAIVPPIERDSRVHHTIGLANYVANINNSLEYRWYLRHVKNTLWERGRATKATWSTACPSA